MDTNQRIDMLIGFANESGDVLTSISLVELLIIKSELATLCQKLEKSQNSEKWLNDKLDEYAELWGKAVDAKEELKRDLEEAQSVGMICELRQQLADSQKDAARLDWLCSRGAYVANSTDGEYCNVWLPALRDGTPERPAEGYPQKCYDTWREAIDAAMQKDQSNEA